MSGINLNNYIYGGPEPSSGPGYTNPFTDATGYEGTGATGDAQDPTALPVPNTDLPAAAPKQERTNPFTMEALMPYLQNRDHAMLGGVGIGGTLGGLLGGGKGAILGALLGVGGGYLANQWANNKQPAA